MFSTQNIPVSSKKTYFGFKKHSKGLSEALSAQKMLSFSLFFIIHHHFQQKFMSSRLLKAVFRMRRFLDLGERDFRFHGPPPTLHPRALRARAPIKLKLVLSVNHYYSKNTLKGVILCWFNLWIWIVLIDNVLFKPSRAKKSGSQWCVSGPLS